MQKKFIWGFLSPPIKHPDFYGIDTPNYSELLAANHNIEEMTEIVGATSLFFISWMALTVTYESRDSVAPQYTDHCFTGDYPIEVKDLLKVRL